MDERTKAIDSAVRNFASVWQTATAAYDAGVAAERERWTTPAALLLDHAIDRAVAAERERCAVVCDFADGHAAQREHGAKLAALIRGA